LYSLPPTANGAPPGKPFIRIYLSCGSLQQHAPADDAKFAEIHDGYDKVDVTNPDDQVFLAANHAANQPSHGWCELSPEQEIARGSGSSVVSPHLMAESEIIAAPISVIFPMPSTFFFFLKLFQVTATLKKRVTLMNQRLSGAPILAADIDSRRASVLPQALQDKVCIFFLCNMAEKNH
jgi:hypothetical protein